MKPIRKLVVWLIEEAEYAPKLIFWVVMLIFVGFPIVIFLGNLLAWGLATPP